MSRCETEFECHLITEFLECDGHSRWRTSQQQQHKCHCVPCFHHASLTPYHSMYVQVAQGLLLIQNALAAILAVLQRNEPATKLGDERVRPSTSTAWEQPSAVACAC